MRLLIDGNNVAHTLYGILLNRKESPACLVPHFLRQVGQYIERFSPQAVLCIFDSGRSARHLRLFPQYKQNRKVMDSLFADTLDRLAALLPHTAVATLRVPGVEGDDLLGIHAIDSVLISEDSDVLQLITETTTVYAPRADRLYTPTTFEHHPRYGFLRVPQRLIDYKALAGDTTDNIPGLTGPETAKWILIQYPDGLAALTESVRADLAQRTHRAHTLAGPEGLSRLRRTYSAVRILRAWEEHPDPRIQAVGAALSTEALGYRPHVDTAAVSEIFRTARLLPAFNPEPLLRPFYTLL